MIMQIIKKTNVIFIISFIWFFTFACVAPTNNKITIHGKVIGSKANSVRHTIPINNLCYWGFYDTVKIDSTGNFQINLETQKTSFIEIIINKSNVLLIVEAGDVINLTYDFTRKDELIDIEGNNASGQLLLNKLPNPFTLRMVGATRFLDTLNVDEVEIETEKKRKKDFSSFNQLFEQVKISASFLEFAKSDRACYYEALKATYVLVKFLRTDHNELTSFPSEFKIFWKNIFEHSPITKNKFFYSRWWYDYAENFLNYNEFLDDSFSIKKLEEIYTNGKIHSHNLSIAKLYIDNNKMLEFYTAKYLYDAAIQKDYEKELITLFEKFISTFPESPYSDHISYVIKPIIAYHKAQMDDFEIDLVLNPDSLNSIKDCIKRFSGKPLFIDVWASWCGPCKEEFKYKANLDKLLHDYGFELLYISIDDERSEDKWKEMIKGYKLTGKHVRANKNLDKDLREIFNRGGAISIPWYMIINKHGEIVVEHASKPSQISMLEEQLLKAKANHE